MTTRDIQNALGVITAGLICLSGSVEGPRAPRNINVSFNEGEPHVVENNVFDNEVTIDSFTGDTTRTVTGETILTDDSIHEELAWMTYDNIPEPYHSQLLSDFQTTYNDVITDTTITDSTYRSLPTPVRQANLLNRINEHVKQTSLTEHYESPDAATKTIGATIMTESFFNQDATNPANATLKTADVGYGQVSKWTRSYLHETESFPAATDSSWFNAETQIEFMTTWFERLHDAEHPNAVAIAAYNAGKTAAMNRAGYATSYYATWHDRHTRYFENPRSQTQQWILDQAGLQ